MKKTLLIVILLAAGIAQLMALPYTFSGNTVNIPEAYILNHKMASVHVAFAPGVAERSDGSEDLIFNVIGTLNFGLYDRGEVGLVVSSYGEPYVNLKLNILKEERKTPELSLGITNLFTSVRDEDYPDHTTDLIGSKHSLIKNSPYIAASKKAIMVSNITGLEYMELKGTLGWGMRRFKAEGDLAKLLMGFFFNVDFRPTRFLSVFGEVDGENLNAGMVLYSKRFTYQFSIHRIQEAIGFITDEGIINVGMNIGYKFDHFADKKIVHHDKDYYSYYKSIAPLIEKRIYMDEMELQEEASLYEMASESSYFVKAENCYEKGNFTEAIEYYDQVIINAGNEVPIALYHIGLCYQEMGDMEKRDNYWHKLVIDFPEHYLVTKVIAEDDKFAKVSEAPRRSYKKQGEGITYKTSDSPRFQYKEALMHYHFEDYAGAAEKFQMFIKNNPGHGLIHNAKFLLANSLKNSGNHQEAIKINEEIMPKAGARKAETLLSIAESQIALKNYDQAKLTLDKVLNSYAGSFHAAQAESLMKKIPKK